ncbi:MAG: BON domain-containing protein [Deltaproteobacteria bacterium]|nr:BON domain-containing protein [Deltaproteobacteria bacterium]
MLMVSFAGSAFAEGTNTVPPDNSGVNVRDAAGGPPTPVDQSNEAPDLELTQSLRRALMAEGSLSINAKNVKIVTVRGVVTLRGPVATAAERDWINAKALQLAGTGKVVNQLEVVQNKPNE